MSHTVLPGRVVVRRRRDLDSLLRAGRRAARAPILVQLPGLPPAEAARASARLGSLAADCGCAWGAVAMASAFVVALAAAAAAYPPPSVAFAVHAPLAVAAAFVGAAAGKAAGLVRARRSFRREVERLLDATALEG